LLVPWRCSQWCAVASLFLSHTNTHARKFIRLELCFCQGATNPPTLSRLFALHAAPVKLHPPVPLVHTLHVSVRSDPWTYCYLYGLMIHKLGHFHDIVHGETVQFIQKKQIVWVVRFNAKPYLKMKIVYLRIRRFFYYCAFQSAFFYLTLFKIVPCLF